MEVVNIVGAHTVCSGGHPLLDANNYSKDELVKAYFEKGYTNVEIAMSLVIRHAIIISVTTVKRILRRLHLKRRTASDNIEDVVKSNFKRQGGFWLMPWIYDNVEETTFTPWTKC